MQTNYAAETLSFCQSIGKNGGNESDRASLHIKEVDYLQRENNLLNKLIIEMECSNKLLNYQITEMKYKIPKIPPNSNSSFFVRIQ